VGPDDGNWRWLYGAFLASVALAVIGHDLVSNCAVPPPGEPAQLSSGWCAEAWVNRYQGLIAGLLALFGALVTVFAIWSQIKQSDLLESERRRREEFAARAILPLALSSLYDYAETCLTVLTSYKDDISEGERNYLDENKIIPNIPEAVIPSLRDCARFAAEETGREIADILAFLQIHSARLRGGRFRKDFGNLDRDDRIFDTAQILAMISRLFPYSRGVVEQEKRELDQEIANSLRVHNVNESEFPHIFRRLELRIKLSKEGKLNWS
jgi:hypothetical protein